MFRLYSFIQALGLFHIFLLYIDVSVKFVVPLGLFHIIMSYIDASVKFVVPCQCY